MRKTLTAALAALTLGGAISATAVTGAEARPFHGHFGHGGRGGGALVAGVAGLAIGAAIAGDRPYYGYYGPGPYAYGPGPYYGGTCFTTRWVWDPYAGRRIPERVPFAC